VSGRASVAILLALLLGSLTAMALRSRLELVSGSVCAVAVLGLLALWPAARLPRIIGVLAAANIGFVCLYFWSQDESYRVVVHLTSSQLSATVDGATTTISGNGLGEFGFQQSSYGTYRVQATGEAGQSDTSSPLGRFAQRIRAIQPASSWTNIRVSLGKADRTPVSPTRQIPAKSWQVNARGEWEGSSDSYVLYRAPSASSFQISADLMRPDGSPAMLVGVNRGGNGYALQVRLEQPDIIWVRWHNGQLGESISGASLYDLPALPLLQRDVRLVLTGYLYALLVVVIALALYPLLVLALGRLGGQDDWQTGAMGRIVGSVHFARAFPVSVAVGGMFATGAVSTYLLGRIPHVQDSVAYLFQAKIFAMGHFSVPAPPPKLQPFFYEEYMPVFHGRWFSQYPPGHPLMLAIGVLAHAPWLVEPVLASLSLGIVYLLGKRVYGQGIGILAALLGLSSPFWLFLGSSFMSHATGLFFAIAFMLCFAMVDEGAKPAWAFLGGFAAGMCFITRELTAVALLVPFVVYAVIFVRVSRRRIALAAAGWAIPPLFLLLYNWVQMGSPFRTTYAAWGPHYTLGFGPTKAIWGLFTVGDGLWNTFLNLSMLSVQLYGWPYAVALAFAFLPFILGAARRWDWLLLASFVSLVASYAFYWCPCLMYGPRFYYEGLAPLLLLTARGIFELGRLPLRVWPRLGMTKAPDLAVFWPALLVTALLLFNIRFYLPAQMSLYDGYNYSSTAQLNAVSAHHIHHALVLVQSDPPGFWASYGNVFFENDPHLQGDIVYAHDLGKANKVLFARYPGRSHYILRDAIVKKIR
jgi:4-amino-4-deoxy-L-arabinose transferase-like glycosyltransferase